GVASHWDLAATGNAFTCGLRGGGEVYCWGINGFGQLGYHTSWKKTSPAPTLLAMGEELRDHRDARTRSCRARDRRAHARFGYEQRRSRRRLPPRPPSSRRRSSRDVVQVRYPLPALCSRAMDVLEHL